jgi:N-methylhydantoinase B
MRLDPITTEVVLSRLREATAAMAHALFHSGYSPILRESQDGTAGLTDAEGRVIMVGGGLQYHSLLYTKSVASILERYPAAAMRDGDSFLSNDPYKAGNSHVPDMVVATPVFHRGAIVGFGVSVAHKADVGGLVPGSSGAASREIFHDGLLLPPVRYWTSAGVNPEVEAIIRNNSRAPDVVVGDLRGQVGATRLGARRMDALCGEYGVETVTAAVASLIERTTARVRAEIARWPDGSFEGEGFMDHDGADRSRPVRIHVRATKKGDRLTLDFGGTDPQTRGPINTPQATAQAVSMQAVLAASDPTIPMNAGAFAAIDFAIPPGRLVSPQFPATVNHYFPTSHLVYNCVLAALGQFNPKRAVAPSGMGTGAIAIGYPTSRMGRPTVQYELMNSSLGGTTEHDGAAMVLPMNHFAPGTPIEIVETEYPVVVNRFDFRIDSAGAGRRRGGIGYLREYRFLTDCILTARTSNHRHAAWGVFGGKSPKLAETRIRLPDGAVAEMDILETRQVERGSTLTLSMSGGGGYGDPFEREPELVLRDVENGYVSRDAAAGEHGVVLTADGAAVDEPATRARRAKGSK